LDENKITEIRVRIRERGKNLNNGRKGRMTMKFYMGKKWERREEIGR
jgi:hypothetical protein